MYMQFSKDLENLRMFKTQLKIVKVVKCSDMKYLPYSHSNSYATE